MFSSKGRVAAYLSSSSARLRTAGRLEIALLAIFECKRYVSDEDLNSVWSVGEIEGEGL